MSTAALERGPGRIPGWVGVVVVLAGFVSLALPERLFAQEGCEFGEEGNDVLRQVTMTGGEAIVYVTRPHLVCEDGIQIWADSAVAFTSTDMAHLMGAVRFEEPRRVLRADEARYFSNVGRLQAEGSLVVEDRDEGSTVEHGALVYLRQTSFRDEETMTVTRGTDGIRPRATIRETTRPDSLGPEQDGALDAATDSSGHRVYVIEGDEIRTRGESYLRSVGSVELEVDSTRAFADTLEFDEANDVVDLRGSARVVTTAHELEGARIRLMPDVPGRRRVLAQRAARVSSDDLVLTAERIEILTADDVVDRIVATPADSSARDGSGGGVADRPRAIAGEFEITADSLDVLTPGEVLERVFAAGRARSESTERDSLNAAGLPAIARSDWLEGDTVVISFRPEPSHGDPTMDPVLAPEGAALPRDEPDAEVSRSIDRIEARVGARTLYRLPPSGAGARAGIDPPAVHYVVGRQITIFMGPDGEVDRLEVDGETTGVHLEPRPRGPGSGGSGAQRR